MDIQPEIVISPFQPGDQQAVKELVLAGLVEHWGWLDPQRNPDLNDISVSYANSCFLVARSNGCVVGTGALVPRSADTAEIVRMSVTAEMRRMGLGGRILNELLRQAKADGYQRVILETTDTWSQVIAFYINAGFRITHYSDGDVYFELVLE